MTSLSIMTSRFIYIVTNSVFKQATVRNAFRIQTEKGFWGKASASSEWSRRQKAEQHLQGQTLWPAPGSAGHCSRPQFSKGAPNLSPIPSVLHSVTWLFLNPKVELHSPSTWASL